MKKILIVFILAFALAGCNAIEDMKELAGKQSVVKEAIKKETGWESRIDFQFKNGVFTYLSVDFVAKDVRDKKISYLERIVRKAVQDSFKSTPQTIYIQIVLES